MSNNILKLRYGLDYDILKLLRESNEPLGAVNLSIMLAEKYSASQSTIGRKLLYMDHEGYTKKIKNTGRILTEKGRRFLDDLEDRLIYERMQRAFMESLNPSTLKDLIDILVARRGLEREACRLAAKNATKEHIIKMEQALEEQKRKIAEYGEAGDEEDNRFHRMIALGSGNKVIQITISLLRKQNDLAMHLGTVRKLIGGGELYKEHVKILECIKCKDCSGAEQAMEEHINKIIKEFSNFPCLLEVKPKNLGEFS